MYINKANFGLFCRWGQLAAMVVGLLLGMGTAGAESTPLTFFATDRILVLAPHPDDEVIACGGVIQEVVALHLPVRVAFLTYGDNNEWSFAVYRKHLVLEPSALRAMGEIRHGEAVAAAQVLGLTSNDVVFLGYPDFGTLHIWREHWGDRPPFLSMLTRSRSVPYPDALRVGAPYKGEEVIQDLKTVLRQFRPTKVFVSHAADHNPDHQALYLFTRVALWDLAKEMTPDVMPYLVHYPAWPEPRGANPALSNSPPLTLAAARWQSWELASPRVIVKMNALQKHQTQFAYASRYLESFVRRNELFSDYAMPRESPATGMATQTEAVIAEPAKPQELTDEERAAFIGIERYRLYVSGDSLVTEIVFSRPMGREVGVTIDLMGYRADRPFGDMPKISVRVGATHLEVFERGKEMELTTVSVKRSMKELQVSVPLDVLGRPERVFAGAHSHLGMVPMAWTPWRVLGVPKE